MNDILLFKQEPLYFHFGKKSFLHNGQLRLEKKEVNDARKQCT